MKKKKILSTLTGADVVSCSKENDFLMFGFIIENIKENQIQSKLLKILHFLKFLSP